MVSISSSLGVSKENRGLMYAMYFAFLCSGLVSQLFGAILPFMETEYGLSKTFQGALISAHQVGNLLAVFIAGYLPYAIGRKKSTVSLSSGKALGLLIMGLTGNPALLIIAFALTGVGRGTLSNITNVVISEVSEKKTSALNILHATFAIGAIVSPFLVMLVTKNGGSWRIPLFIIMTLEVISVIAITRSSLSNKPSEKKKGSEQSPFTDPHWWLNTGILFFYLCSEASIMGWLISYFKADGRLGATFSQLSSSFLWITMLTGRLLCASVGGHVRKNKLLFVLGICQTVSFILLLNVKGTPATLTMLLLLGLFMSATYPTTLATMPSRYNGSTIATGNCIAIASIGAIVMPTIVGFVADRHSLAGGIATISVALCCMVVLITIKLIVEKKAD